MVPQDDTEPTSDHLPRWLIILGITCIIAAVVGGSVKAFGVEVPAVDSTARQVLLGLIGAALLISGIVTNLKRKKTAARNAVSQLTAPEREQVRAHISLITESLRQLFQSPQEHEFLIVEVEGIQGFYVQFLPEDSGPLAELVAPHFLKPAHRPDPRQTELIRSYGWQPPNKAFPNFHKQFVGKRDVDMRDAAREVVDLLVNAYRVAPDEPLHVQYGGK